jgi:two-component system, response regulator PdtaR
MSNFRIMIVEDNAIIAMGMERKIKSWGYTVGPVVFSGEEAVDASFREKPDLIIMDIGVKGDLNGIEAARSIKSLEIPIIYVTGRDDAIEEALETVPYALLKKPVTHEVLKHKIRSALEEQRIKDGNIGRK